MRILLHVICRGRREWATDIVFVYLKCYLSKDLLNFKKYSTLGFFSPFFSFPFSFHVENNTQAGSHSYKCCTNELHPLAPKSCLLIQEITKGVRWPISNSSKGFIFTFSTYLEKFSLKKYFEKKKKEILWRLNYFWNWLENFYPVYGHTTLDVPNLNSKLFCLVLVVKWSWGMSPEPWVSYTHASVHIE